jgi:hypothetical protein
MSSAKHFQITELTTLKWPAVINIPSVRFRMFVAVDATGVTADLIGEFVHAALSQGMVYLCAWGSDCERVHDVADEVIVADSIGERRFVQSEERDTIMTTWHDETLDEALDFFANWSIPSGRFEAGSDYWLAVIVGNPEWAATIRRCLAEKFN